MSPTTNILFSIILFICILQLSRADDTPTSTIDVTEALGSVNLNAPQEQQDAIINRYKQYLKINTAQPKPDYDAAVKFLIQEGNRIGLTHKVEEFVKDRPTLILRWACERDCDKKYKSVMLNSHMDVVPVVEDLWNTDPFEAFEDKDGFIYARGAQDMKCVGMQYLEAVDQLKNVDKFKPNRDIFITFVPDEEIGGENGAKQLAESDYFKNEMRVGLAMDEGGPLNEEPGTFTAFYGERQVWWMRFHAKGEEGHASVLTDEPAVEKISRVVEKVFEFRRSQQREMRLAGKRLGEVITINLNEMIASKNGSLNVIPGDATIGVDMRVHPHASHKEVRDMLEKWASDAGCTVEFLYGADVDSLNPITNRDGLWWSTFRETMDNMGFKLDETIFQAATDARYIRTKGIPCLGFSPIDNTPWLLHDHNEKLHRGTYLRGVEIYKRLLSRFTSLEGDEI